MSISPSSPSSDEALASHIRGERVRFVFIQSALPMFFSPIAATVLSIALWHEVGHSLLAGWTAGLALIAAVRVALVRTYPRETPTAQAVRRWERLFVASVLVVDVWWGFGGLLLLQPHAMAERAIVFAFLMLMAGGHAASYAAHPVTVVGGVLALALPVTVTFALTPDVSHRAMAFAAVMYLLATFRSIRTLGSFFGETHRLAHALNQERQKAELLARIDHLTQLPNRRAFRELGEASLRHAERYGHPAALLMLDIDHFKSINDRFGHAAGDTAIRALADVLRQHHRATDIAGRLGGEEFALLLPETSLTEALQLAERLRANVGEQVVQHEHQPLRFTTSLGVAERRGGDSLDQLLARADAALYDAKHGGRNRVVAAA